MPPRSRWAWPLPQAQRRCRSGTGPTAAETPSWSRGVAAGVSAAFASWLNFLYCCFPSFRLRCARQGGDGSGVALGWVLQQPVPVLHPCPCPQIRPQRGGQASRRLPPGTQALLQALPMAALQGEAGGGTFLLLPAGLGRQHGTARRGRVQRGGNQQLPH